MDIKRKISEFKNQFREIDEQQILREVVRDYSTGGSYEKTANINQNLNPDEEKVIDFYFKNKKGKVLALGCGGGREVFAIKKKGFDILGIDISERLIESARVYAKQNKIDIEFYTKDIMELEFLKPKSFDYVIMFKSVIGNIKERVRLLRKIKKVMKPEGILIFTTYYRYSNIKRAISLAILDTFKFFFNIFKRKKLEYSSWRTNYHCYVHMPSVRLTSREIKKAKLKLIKYFYSKSMTYMFFIVKNKDLKTSKIKDFWVQKIQTK